MIFCIRDGSLVCGMAAVSRFRRNWNERAAKRCPVVLGHKWLISAKTTTTRITILYRPHICLVLKYSRRCIAASLGESTNRKKGNYHYPSDFWKLEYRHPLSILQWFKDIFVHKNERRTYNLHHIASWKLAHLPIKNSWHHCRFEVLAQRWHAGVAMTACWLPRVQKNFRQTNCRTISHRWATIEVINFAVNITTNSSHSSNLRPKKVSPPKRGIVLKMEYFLLVEKHIEANLSTDYSLVFLSNSIEESRETDAAEWWPKRSVEQTTIWHVMFSASDQFPYQNYTWRLPFLSITFLAWRLGQQRDIGGFHRWQREKPRVVLTKRHVSHLFQSVVQV